MNRIGGVSGCDVHKSQKTRFERQLTEDSLGLSAIGAGGLDEHDQLPRKECAVHKTVSHGDRLQLSRKEHSVEGTGPMSNGIGKPDVLASVDQDRKNPTI